MNRPTVPPDAGKATPPWDHEREALVTRRALVAAWAGRSRPWTPKDTAVMAQVASMAWDAGRVALLRGGCPESCRHFLNITTLATPIGEDRPSEEALFGPLWERYGR